MIDKPVEEMTLDEIDKYINLLSFVIELVKVREAFGKPTTIKQALQILRIYLKAENGDKKNLNILDLELMKGKMKNDTI